jgi:hypothetical protein
VIIRYTLKASTTISFSSNPVYRVDTTITATTNVSGKVTFLANGKKIPKCIGVATINLMASCTWKPSLHGYITISTRTTSSDASYLAGTSVAPAVLASKRTSPR